MVELAVAVFARVRMPVHGLGGGWKASGVEGEDVRDVVHRRAETRGWLAIPQFEMVSPLKAKPKLHRLETGPDRRRRPT